MVSGIHGRHTHDPARTARALAILAETTDSDTAAKEINEFFESGWVDWDVKTAVEVTCGTIRGRLVIRPLACLHVTREIVLEHERNEQRAFRRYTLLAGSGAIPAALGVGLGVVALVGSRRRRA